eukprot:6204169-Pleurochrysis_carterae.AAC.2
MLALDRDIAAFEKRVKSETKKLHESKGAAESACNKAVRALADAADAAVTRTRATVHRVKESQPPLQPVVKHLQEVILQYEALACEE